MNSKTLIIAEIGTAHQGNIETAKELIHAACEAGADCIKFQWVYADEILHPKTGFVDLPTGKISLYERFKKLEVSKSFFIEIQHYVHSLNKKFMCSPFGIRSLEELFSIQPDYIKIASPELNHIPLLEHLVHLELSLKNDVHIPIVLSSGVSKTEDISLALKTLSPIITKNSSLVSLLHCVTSYPAPPQDYNLSVLQTLQQEYKIPVGVSDHSLDPILIPVLSLAYGASIIEKHITLSKETDGLDDPVALTPQQFEQMVKTIRNTEKFSKDAIVSYLLNSYSNELLTKTIGNGKKVLAESERNNYGRTNRSIHFMRDMKKGETITENDIAILRTEKELSVGIEPRYFNAIIGKKLHIDAIDGEGLTEAHFEAK